MCAKCFSGLARWGTTLMDEASSWNYEDWAELIFSNFFNEENAGEEILFAVDDAVLAEISGLSE